MYAKESETEKNQLQEKNEVATKELFAAVYSSLTQLDANTQHNILNDWRSKLLEEKSNELVRLRTLADKLEKEIEILKN